MKKMAILAMIVFAVAGCKNSAKADLQKIEPVSSKTEVHTDTVVEITSIDQFNQIITKKNRLMVFDLYADWCKPCKMLAPILLEVAKTHGSSADFYKVNTEKFPQIARLFPSEGIPYVVFFKDSTVVNALTGLYPKEAYEQNVGILSQPIPETASGTVQNGIRKIEISGDTVRGNFVTYGGDKVELTIQKTGKPFTVTSDMLKISGASDGKTACVVAFDTKELGAFPVTIVDESGQKDQLWILVNKYEAQQSGYREVSASEFASAMKQSNVTVLDVRTREEYIEGHIAGAVLIPVQELQERLSEIEKSKNQSVLVYCRSGHRSTVASKILNESGFQSVTNLTGGIKAWSAASLPVEK